jgi:hypothetical protein
MGAPRTSTTPSLASSDSSVAFVRFLLGFFRASYHHSTCLGPTLNAAIHKCASTRLSFSKCFLFLSLPLERIPSEFPFLRAVADFLSLLLCSLIIRVHHWHHHITSTRSTRTPEISPVSHSSIIHFFSLLDFPMGSEMTTLSFPPKYLSSSKVGIMIKVCGAQYGSRL